jgi:hypothetical protein
LAELGPVTRILQARILAVALQSTKTLSEAQRRIALDQWERTTFRIFGLAGRDSRYKVGDYVRLADRVMNEDKATLGFDEIMQELRFLGVEFPTKQVAKEALAERNIYEDDPEMCRYILWRYEEHLADLEGRKATVDAQERNKIYSMRASESIEHIYPQNPEWDGPWPAHMVGTDGKKHDMSYETDRIGNLVLLPGGINSEIQRKGFTEKRLIYKRHHLRQIDEIAKKRNWDLKAIEAREKKIVSWAAKAWRDVDPD